MKVLEGVRVVELASWLFVPAAGAILADWGADVIKVEHPERPDPQRSLVVGGMSDGTRPFTGLLHQANRGKRSIGLDISTPDGYEILTTLLIETDVFLTNLLPASRRHMRVEPDDIKAINPGIVYARGSGYGQRGPESETPGFDGTTYWARGGIAESLTPSGAPEPTPLAPAMGDLPGATALAGAVAAGLFHRARTGAGSVVDVSLLNVAVWGGAPAVLAAAAKGAPLERQTRNMTANPGTLAYRTADGRFVKLSLLQSDRFFGELCERLGVPELLADPRFSDSGSRMRNSAECVEALDAAFGALTLAEVRTLLATFRGPWAVVQNAYEVTQDPQVLANEYLLRTDGDPGYLIAASPWEFEIERHPLRPAPDHGADTDDILLELGLGWDEILKHKQAGTVL
jgi:crotonobetainyl-CoA:carnitine CoA-transferase CaiB-like acyl-CoA transferase